MREYLGLELAPVLVDRDPSAYRDADIEPDIWVRSADGGNRRLWARKDDGAHRMGLFPFVPITDLERGRAIFKGWLFGHEILRPQYWLRVNPKRPPQYYVPNEKLRSASTFYSAWTSMGTLF